MAGILTVREIDRDGVVVALVTPTVTGSGGNLWPNRGEDFVEVRSAATPFTLSVWGYGTIKGLDSMARDIAVAADEDRMLGPFSPELFNAWTVLASGVDGVTVVGTNTFTAAAGVFVAGHIGMVIDITGVGKFKVATVVGVTEITVLCFDGTTPTFTAKADLTYSVADSMAKVTCAETAGVTIGVFRIRKVGD